MPKIIIFDLDGVLFDSCTYAYEYLVSIYPTMTPEISLEILCGNFHDELDKFKLNHEAAPATEEEKAERKLKYAEGKLNVPLFPGIKNLLEDLHKLGYILVVNTSAFKRNSLPLFEKTDTLKYFDMIADAEISKSKLEKFKLIEEKYNVPKENVVFITDTLGDLREADIAGVPTIAVTWGAHSKDFFEREEHKNLLTIVDTMPELEEEINKYFKA